MAIVDPISVMKRAVNKSLPMFFASAWDYSGMDPSSAKSTDSEPPGPYVDDESSDRWMIWGTSVWGRDTEGNADLVRE